MSVEFALALPAVLLVLALSLSALAWTLTLQAAQRAAGEAARAAVTLPDPAAAEAGRKAGAPGPVALSRAGGFVTACVDVRQPPWPATRRCATARDSP